MPFEIIRNDITKMKVDAIVNAANHSLLGGGGVDGAIHSAAGPQLLEECRGLNGCATGQAKVTKGYGLPAKYVIHTVGPVWHGGGYGEKEQLASCYRESLLLAEKKRCETVAFPLISAGAYGYPQDQALKVATDTILAFLADHDMHVFLVIFGRSAWMISRNLYANIQAYIDDSYIGPDFEREQQRRRLYNMARPKADVEELALDSIAFEAAAREDKACAPMVPMTGAAQETSEELKERIKQLDESFREMLLRKIDEKGITDAQCYKKANVDRKLFNKIKNHKNYRTSKPTALALAIALELPEQEIREMLRKAGYALNRNERFDVIVQYFLERGIYNVFEINAALFDFDQKLLGS